MPSLSRVDIKDEIDAELKWVEDNLPAAPGAALLPSEGGFSRGAGRSDLDGGTYKDKRPDQRSWLGAQPPWLQCLIAFVVFVIGLNFLMWLGGAHQGDDPTLRGNYRMVHGGLDGSETPEELASEVNPGNP